MTAAPVVTRRTGSQQPATSSELRRAGLTGIVVLAILNVADVVTTRLMLSRGGFELNPVADRLLESNMTLAVKLSIVGALAVVFVRHGPRAITVCVIWLVAGFYLCAVVINGSQLVAALHS